MNNLKMNNFAEVISCLKNGGNARRKVWKCEKQIVMQRPQYVKQDFVQNMQSIPSITKAMIGAYGNGAISYHDQVLIITFSDDRSQPATATSYMPTWEDIFAEDWEMITPA